MEKLNNYLTYLQEGISVGVYDVNVDMYNINNIVVMNVKSSRSKGVFAYPWFVVLFTNESYNDFKKGKDIDKVYLSTSLPTYYKITNKLDSLVPIESGQAVVEPSVGLRGMSSVYQFKGISFLQGKHIRIEARPFLSQGKFLIPFLGPLLFDLKASITFV